MNQIYENIPAACPSDEKKLARAPNRISMVSVRFVDPVTYRHRSKTKRSVSPNGFELCESKQNYFYLLIFYFFFATYVFLATRSKKVFRLMMIVDFLTWRTLRTCSRISSRAKGLVAAARISSMTSLTVPFL